MRPRQQALLSLLETVFADGIITPDERADLLDFYRQKTLSVAEVREVMTTFVETTWRDALADRVLTDDERAKLVTIVRELKVPRSCMPEAVAFLFAA